MKSGRMVRGTLALLLATLLIVDGLAAVQPAEAGEFLNFLVGGMRVINALNRRNRTYRAARDTQRDFNVYYDSLTDTAHDQLLSGDLQSLREGEEGLERVRLAAFIRLSAALQAEQAAVTQAIEAEKNQARVEFNRSLVRQLQSIITQLPGAQRVLSDVRDTISHIRSTVIAIQTAAAANQPLEPLAQQLAEQVAFSAELQQGVRSLGSALGVELDHILGGALSQVEAALGDIKQEVNQTVELLDTMDTQLDQVYLTPTELEISEIDIGPANVQLTDRATAVIDVASQALAFLSAAQGTGGTTRQQLYQQIRADLLEGHNQALLNAVQHVSQVDCTAVGKGEYEAAAGMLGVAPGAAGDPEKARYMVCTDRETGYVIRAWIVEGGPTPTPEANVTATVTHEPQPTAVQGTPATVASCDAMSYLTFSSIYYDNYVDTGTCVAVIDATNLSETTPVIYTLRWTDGQLRNRPLPPQQKGTVELIYTGNFETIFLEWVVARFDTGPCNELFANVSDEEMSGTGLQVYTSDVTTCDWWAGSRP
jgi:hypothetical protein